MAGNYTIPVDVELRTKQQNVKNLRSAIENEFRDIDFNSSIGKQLNKLFNQFDTKISDMDSILGKGMLDMGDLNKLNGIFNRMNLIVGQMRSSAHKAPLVDLGIDAQSVPELVEARNLVKQITSEMTKQKAVSTKDRLKQTGQQDLLDDLNKIQKTRAHENKPLGVNAKIIQDELAEAEQLIKQHYEKRDQLDKQFQEKSAKAKQSQKILDDAEADYVKNAQKASLKQIMALETAAGKKGKKSTLESQFGGGNKLSQKSAQKFLDEFMVEAGMAFEGTQISGTLTQKLWEGMFTENEIAQMQQAGGDMGEALYVGLEQKLRDPNSRERFRQIVHDFSKETTGSAEGYANTADNIKKNLPNLMNQAKTDAVEVQAIEQSQIDNANAIATLEPQIASFKAVVDRLTAAASTLETVIQNKYQKELNEANKAAEQAKINAVDQSKPILANAQISNQPIPQYQQQGIQVQEAEKFKANLQQSIKQWMGVREVINYVKQGIRQAWTDIQGLDKAMTNIAVVTDFNVSDLWGKINEYMGIAKEYGVTTQGVYEVSQLYFQQGLGEADTMAATTETLKMARIAGMDYAEAADGMTVAIRGFNMEMSEASRVTDVYSKVAAITASDTQELVTAMSKTASSAAAVGSSFENTTAMLAVMIEATRESPQNLGSALKSIISRYGEMTKGLTEDSEGEEIDYNRVDAALKTVGISIKDAQGQFRDFDTVIEELSAKWDTLDSVTQRYIATIFAGNRQQSRFLALVSNYDRYMEVSEAAANSEDAGLLQYSKTLDSLETKMNNIKTGFQQFYMGLIDGPTIGKTLDFINNLITGFNKLGKLQSLINIGSIIMSAKNLGTLLVDSLASPLSSLGSKFASGLSGLSIIAETEGAEAGRTYKMAFDKGASGGSKGGRGWLTKHSGLASGLSMAGSAIGLGLTAAGTSIVGKGGSKNLKKGAWLSMAGNAASGAAMGLSVGGPWGAAIGGVVGALSGLPGVLKALDKNVQRQADYDQQKQITEEKNIERAKAKEEYNSLRTGIEKVQELDKTKYDSTEDYQAWVDANNSLVEAYPSMLGYIDEAGNSIADLSSSSEMLSDSMQKAAEASRDYYVNKVKEIQMGMDNNRDYSFRHQLGALQTDRAYRQEGAEIAQLLGGHQEETFWGMRDFLTVEELVSHIDSLKGTELEWDLNQVVQEGTKGQFSNENNQRVFELLKELKVVKEDDNGNVTIDQHVQDYLTAEKQLQQLYSTKEAAMQSGVNLASLQSAMDDSVSSIEGYSSLVVELGKLHIGADWDENSYQELANLDVDTYDAIVSPFVNLYDSLSSTKQQALGSLGGELLNFSLDDLITHLSDTFGVTEGSAEYGGIYQAYINNWKEQNYLAQQKLFNSIWGTPEMEIDSYSEWLKSDAAPEFAEDASTEEKKEAYRLWVQQQIASFAEGRDELFNLLFEQDGENGGFKMKVSANEAEQISQFVADQESMAEKSTNIFIRDAAEARKETLTQLFAQMSQIDFNSRAWRGSAELTAAEDMFGINMADWEESDVLSFKNLLVDPDAGSTEWQGKLNELAQKYNETINWNGASLSELLYTSFSTQINTTLDGMSDILSGISDLSSSQEKGFDWEESQKILKQLDGQTWEDVFETTEDGLIVLKDYNKTLDDLYGDDAQKFEDLATEIEDLTEVNTETGLPDTQMAAFEQLKQFREQGEAQGLDLTDPANQQHLAGQLTTTLGISDSLAGDIISWASTAENVTQESFDAYLESLFGSATAAAEYLGNMIDRNKQETAYNKYYKDNYGAIDKAREAIESPSLDAIKDYAITTGKIKEYKDKAGNYDWAKYFSELEGDSTKGFNISEFGTVTVTDATAAVEALTGKTAEKFTTAEKLLVDLFTQNLIQTLEDISEEVKSLATQVASGEELDVSDVQNAFSSYLGEENEALVWEELLRAITTDNFTLFSNVIKSARPEAKDEEIKQMWSQYSEGVTVGTQEYTENLIDNQSKIISGEFTDADLAKMEDGPLKDAIRAFKENVDSQFTEYVNTVVQAYANKQITFEDASSYLTTGYEAEFDKVFGFETDIAASLAETDSWDRGTAAEFLGQLNTLTGDSYSLQDWFQQRADGTFELIKSEQELLSELDQIDDEVAKQQIKDSYKFLKGWHKQAKKESALSELEGLATQSEFTATEIRDFYSEQLNQVIGVGAAEIIAARLESLDPMERLNEWVEMYQNAGISIDGDKYQQLVSLVLDSIMETISSGLSNLSSGIDGSLSFSDFTALSQKYGLSGEGALTTSKGVRLGQKDQKKLIGELYKEAESSNLQGEFGDQLWQTWLDSEDSAIQGYQDIEDAIANCYDNQGNLNGVTQEYVEALQQARHSAMFDENAYEFAFMEQEVAGGLVKNFDKFVSQIDKVKETLTAFQNEEKVGYQDFSNMMDFIQSSEAGFAKFTELTGVAGANYEAFVNSVIANTDEWGKVDIGGVAAEMGISVEAAMQGMSEGMAEGLKEVAKSQIKYLSSLEAMLQAMMVLESLESIDMSMNFSFTTNTGEEINFTLNNLKEVWDSLPEEDHKRFLVELETQMIQNFGEEDGRNLFNAIGGDGKISDMDQALLNFVSQYQASDAVKAKIAEIGGFNADTIRNIMSTMNLDYSQFFDAEGNWINGNAQEAYNNMMATFFGEVENIDTNEALRNHATEVQNLMQQQGGEPITVTVDGQQYNVQVNEEGRVNILDGNGNVLNADSFLGENGLGQEVLDQITTLTGEALGAVASNGAVNAEGDFTFDLSASLGVEQLNTDFTTAAEAADTLQTAITNITSAASSFQGGSGFQTLADQLNAAAGAAERLNEALGSAEGPDTSFIESQLAGAEQALALLQMGGAEPEIIANAEAEVAALQMQLNSLTVPEGTTAGLVRELTTAIDIANQLSAALSNNNGTPLEVNFNADDANGQVTALITNLLQLNDVFQPTITVEMAEAEAAIANFLMSYVEVVETSDPVVDVTAVTEPAATQLQDIINKIGSINSKEVEIKVTTIYETISSPSGLITGDFAPAWTGTVNNITGSAFANGNVDTLNAGAKLANKTLVGELGPELAVYDGQYHLLGQTGAEFVDLPDNALIFNHLQTAGIISGQMKNARAQAFKGRADSAIAKAMGSAMATGNVTGPAFASGIGAALSAVRRAKSVWQGLLNSLSAADLMKGGGGGGGGGDESLKAHIADLQEWYNLSRQIADIEGQINVLLAKRKNITDGHEYLRNLRETQRLLDDQVNTQQDLLRFQELQLQRQAEHINSNKIWSQFLEVDENGLLQYKKGNETNGGKGALEVLSQMNEMSGEEQLAFVQSLGWSYTNTDGEELENEELVGKFYEELQKQIDDYDALRDTVQETEGTLADLEEQINEIEKEIRDNEIDLSKEIYDIIVDAWEENIKNLKEQNDLIKEANEAYANGIQEAINAERQMYDQNTAISDREQLQRQLALMRRSGGSASEIADLEQQLDDMLKEEYFSNQEKQLETIQKANERQVELMDQQVKLQEEALEYEKENGVIWAKVYEVMQGTDAEILDFMQGNKTDFFEQSALQQEDMLTEWAKKIGIYTEERQRQNYAAEAAKTFGNVWNNETGRGLQDAYNRAGSAQQEKWKREYNDTYASKMLEGKSHEEALKLAQEEFYEHLRNWMKAEEDKKKQQQQATTSSSGQSSEGSGTSERNPNQRWKASGRYGNSQGDRTDVAYGRTKEEALKNLPHPRSFYNISYGAYQRYVKGGIIDYTGPAWVDGSKSKPERILSAEQNKILEEGLAMNAGRSDKLREMFSNFAENLGASVRASISNITNRTSSSAITIQPGAIQLNIEQLNDKYDVDELFNDVADRLYSIAAKASGRGVSRR